MKSLSFLIIIFIGGLAMNDPDPKDVYQYQSESIDGEVVSLSEYEGKVLLIVNTASECGFTPQYEGLQALYEQYREKGLVILGFPANNFGGQEPGTDEEIKQFCKVNYGVSFPMFSKISVKGDDIHPLFDFLTSAPNDDFAGPIKWNFEKFLVNRDGELVHRYRSDVEPESKNLTDTIEKLLSS